MHRRSLLLSTLPLASGPRAAIAAPTGSAVAPLRFPRDFGAHPAFRTEWWYVTGELSQADRRWGFQVTFFRSSTGLGDVPDETRRDESATSRASRFTPTELVFAHAALTDLDGARLRHDQRIARSGFGIAEASTNDTAITLRDWQLQRTAGPSGSRYQARVVSDRAGFAFDFRLAATQPVLLQGADGLSRKGPADGDVSRYYSEPQLAVDGTLMLDGRRHPVAGRAWLDHEWSDAFVPDGAVGWDWIGINLDDGAALTAFRLRRADGTSLYAGGSYRRGGAADAIDFPSAGVAFTAGRLWQSPTSRARYPVEWQVDTPAGRWRLRARLDAQELDSRGSTGAVYWEGLADLLDTGGRVVGRGYLEMTGYVERLRL